MLLPKDKRYENDKLTRLAQGQDCKAEIANVCNGDPATVVAAHSNWMRHGKGKSRKAHDCFIAWMCSSCHAELDQGHHYTREEKLDLWRNAFDRTLLAMWQLGLLQVKGKK